MTKPKFKTLYNYEQNDGTINNEDSLTQQSDAPDTDLNIIMKRFGATGQLPSVIGEPLYGDFTGLTSYTDALEAVRKANDAFLEIPANVREKFGNDPAKFMDFAADPKNLKALREWGLEPPEPTITEKAYTAKELRDLGLAPQPKTDDNKPSNNKEDK